MIDYAFKEGDVVYLKSGGPAMTITDIEYGREIISGWVSDKVVKTKEIKFFHCFWFDKNQHTCSNYFSPCALTYVNPEIKLFEEYFGSVA